MTTIYGRPGQLMPHIPIQLTAPLESKITGIFLRINVLKLNEWR